MTKSADNVVGITGTVGLDGADGAFGDLRSPERRAKILIDPGLE